MGRKALIVLCLISVFGGWLIAGTTQQADGCLPRSTERMVNDYCHLLTRGDSMELEQRLRAFSDSTSNQIVIVITPTFGGRDIASFAFELGEAWGIGQEDLDNGVLIVVKPKTEEEYGEVEIATGMGLEAVLPDIFCKRIIENEMIPRFRDEDYYGGIVAALKVIEPVCRGEYDYAHYRKKEERGIWTTIGIALLFMALCIFLTYRGTKRGWITLAEGGGSSTSTIYGGGNTSWGGGSGGFGGFGGFGGGHFGGGGASGHW